MDSHVLLFSNNTHHNRINSSYKETEYQRKFEPIKYREVPKAMTNEQTSIQARRAPIQKRSIERVGRILDVTAEMLQEVGVDGVKTTEIARRAEIKLASLYRYFPNKNAILKSLAERQFERLKPIMASFLQNFDLDDGLDKLIDVYADFYRNEPGYMELWAGIQGVPELNQLDMDDL